MYLKLKTRIQRQRYKKNTEKNSKKKTIESKTEKSSLS